VPTDDQQLSSTMAEVARALEASSEGEDTATVITRQACRVVPGVDFASISINHVDGRVETVAATDAVVAQTDRLQHDMAEGPCRTSALEHVTVYAPDLATDDRWPSYGAAAVSLGIHAQLAVELYTTGSTQAAINMYSRTTDAFGQSAHIAELFASQAAVALGFAKSVSDRDEALIYRGVIGQAIGIVMERFHVDEVQAFNYLIRTSQSTNTKLRVVADGIIGELNEAGRGLGGSTGG
jgi:GAF domain-containing protein